MTLRRRPWLEVLLLRLATLYWAGQMFWLSSDSFQTSNSRALIEELTRALGLDLPSETLWAINTITRKSAHVAEYAIFSTLLYFSFLGRDRWTWDQRVARLSLLAACAYAMLDELHQGFSLYRGSSPFDFALDCFGAALGLSMVFACFRPTEAKRSGGERTESGVS